MTTSQSFTRPSLLVAVDYSAYYSAEPLSLNFYTVLRPDGFAQKQIPHLIPLFRNDLLDQVFYQVIVSPLHQVPDLFMLFVLFNSIQSLFLPTLTYNSRLHAQFNPLLVYSIT
jgi:hypothetical protein